MIQRKKCKECGMMFETTWVRQIFCKRQCKTRWFNKTNFEKITVYNNIMKEDKAK